MCAFPTPPPLRPKPPRPGVHTSLKDANPAGVRLVMITTISVYVVFFVLFGALLVRLTLWPLFVRMGSPYALFGIAMVPFISLGVWFGIYFGIRIIVAALMRSERESRQ